MKRIMTVCLFVSLFLVTAIQLCAAQTTNDTIMVRRGDLQTELVKELEARQSLALMAQKIETYGKWVGVGKEVGMAVNESLSAVTDQADKFAKTGVGKFTLFLVAWKVLGKDFIGVVIGVPLLVVWTALFVTFWRRLYCARRILDGTDDKGNKKYREIEPKIGGEERTIATAALFMGYLVANVWTIAGLIFH